MDYLQLIRSMPQEKTALITDEELYTYGRLANSAQAIRQQIDFSERVHFIHKSKIVDQLLDFLAYSGTSTVPVIATEASRGQSFVVDNVPEAALMALKEIVEAKCLVFHKEDADVLVAFVGAEGKIGRMELVERLRAAELTDYEIPKQFIFMTSLPKNESGKIDKKALQEYKL